MALKWKTILDQNTALNPVFYGNVSYNKTLEDGSSKTYTFLINIPDFFAKMYCGSRRVSKVVRDMYNEDPATFMSTELPIIISTVLANFQYKIGALIESNTLYFNPLWNVDGSEKVTEDRAKREHNTENKFGDGLSYTTQIQYGQDTNTSKYGNNAQYTEEMQYGLDENTHKTNPFDDQGTAYQTDVDSRAIHTDTKTFNPHTDVVERSQHTDTTTYNPHTDKGKIEDLAYKDIITTERHGNIGVTKSTELLKDARDLPTELYAPVLDMFMKYLSRGY